jgi:hypothetical protein
MKNSNSSNNNDTQKLQHLQVDVSGAVRQYLKGLKVSKMFCLAIRAERRKILPMTKYAEEKQDMQSLFR